MAIGQESQLWQNQSDPEPREQSQGHRQGPLLTTFQPSNLPTLQLTPDHPVYVEGKGWLWAENLAVGDRLRRSDGSFAKVLAVERVKLAEPQLVYNFTVKGPHTYFVLEVGVLVHNVGGSRALDEVDKAWKMA